MWERFYNDLLNNIYKAIQENFDEWDGMKRRKLYQHYMKFLRANYNTSADKGTSKQMNKTQQKPKKDVTMSVTLYSRVTLLLDRSRLHYQQKKRISMSSVIGTSYNLYLFEK